MPYRMTPSVRHRAIEVHYYPLSCQVLKELEFFHPHHVCYSFWGPYELLKV